MKLLDFSSRSGLSVALMGCAVLMIAGLLVSHLRMADQWVKVAGMLLQMMAAIALFVIGMMLKWVVTSEDLLLAAQKTAEQQERVQRAFAEMIPKYYRFRELGWLAKTTYVIGILAGLATSVYGIAMLARAAPGLNTLPERARIFVFFLGFATFLVGLAMALMTHLFVRHRTLDRYDEMKREIFREFGIK